MSKKKKVFLVILGIWAVVAIWTNFIRVEKGEIAVTSGGANYTAEQNRNYQKSLINLNGKYLEAVLATNSVFFADMGSISYEEWRRRLDNAINLWNAVELESKNLERILRDMAPRAKHSKIPLRRLERNGLVAEVYAVAPETGAVTAVFDAAPPGKRLRKVMEVFKLDKEKAMYFLKQEQELLKADAWNKAGDTYKRWETAARVIKDVSKVTVFVGSNIITAGGAGAAVSALQGAGVVFGGASLVMEVGEDVYISIGSEDKAAVIKKAANVLAGPTEYISLLSLNPNKLADPGNVLYLIDKTGQVINFAREAKEVYVDMKKSRKRVAMMKKKTKELRESRLAKKKSETKTAGLPKGKYRIDGQVYESKGPKVKPSPSPKGTQTPTVLPPDEALIKTTADIANIAEILSLLEAANTLDIQTGSTRATTGDAKTIKITIPEGFKPPFKIKDMSEGGSGGALALPSRIESNTFTAEFISSKDGVFSPEIQIIDANGKVVSGGTTIYVGDADESGDSEVFVRDESEIGTESGSEDEINYPRNGPNPSCPFIYVKKDKEWVIQNDLISVARSTLEMKEKVQQSKQYTDYLALDDLPDLEGDQYHLQVREIRDEISYLDKLAIYAVDHDKGTSISTDLKGGIWAFRKEELVSPKGAAESLSEWDRSYQNVFHEESLDFDFSEVKPGDDSIIVIRFDGFEGEAEGNTYTRPKLVFQSKDERGEWIDRDFIYPREFFTTYALNTKGWFDKNYEVRVKVYSCHTGKYHRIDFLGIDVDGVAERIEVQKLDLDYPANSEELADIKRALSFADGNYLAMPRDSWFEIVAPARPRAKDNRTLVVETVGYYVALR